MYGIFLNGGKQYRVKKGQNVRLEKLDVEIGKIIEFDKILMISQGENTQIGTPFLKKTKIKANVIKHGRCEKIKVIKYNRRKHYKKSQGHRQAFTDVKILEINNFN